MGPIITAIDAGLTDAHGTGAQMRRLFSATEVSFFHCYWSSHHSGPSSSRNSFCVEDPRGWKWLRGRGFVAKLQAFLGMAWWRENRIDKKRFQRLIRRRGFDCDVLYIIVSGEGGAQRALSLREEFRTPAVVHLMDLCEVGGIGRAQTPALAELLESSDRVLVLNEVLLEEVGKLDVREARVLRFGQDPVVPVASGKVDRGEFRVAMVGTLYRPGLELLQVAWPMVLKACPRARLLYTGARSPMLREAGLDFVDDLGFLNKTADYLDHLASCHLAYLPGPSLDDCFARFSVPSRLADYLMAGLPVVAKVSPVSATARFIRGIPECCASIVENGEQFSDTLLRFAQDQNYWVRASAAARNFALEKLSTDIVRRELFDVFQDAVRAWERSPASKAGLAAQRIGSA